MKINDTITLLQFALLRISLGNERQTYLQLM